LDNTGAAQRSSSADRTAARVDLSWSDALALTQVTRELMRSPELRATLTAIRNALVPAHAARVLVALSDPRLATGADPAAAHPDASLALVAGGESLGRLYLFGPRSDPRGALFAEIAAACAAALATAARFERERHVALTFQNAALASTLTDSPAFTFDSFYQPGKTEALVGGDWFDAFPLPDGRVVISVGDVLGSGLAAAIAMVNVRQTIRGVAQVVPDPAVVLEAADRTLQAQYPDRFATAFLAVLDPVTQRCTFANAGHPQPLIRRADGTLAALAGRGTPLGLGFGAPLNVQVADIALEPGSLLVLYTDGLTESTHDVVEGEERLERALRDAEAARSPYVARYLHDAVLGGSAADDVAILVVGVRDGTPVRSWRFDPAWNDVARRVRDELIDDLRAAGFDHERRTNVELVFAELVSNAVRYAPGTIELILERSDDRIVLHVLDRGPGYRVNPNLPSDLYSEFGRGLFLVGSFADRFVVERRPGGGSHARITFTRTSGGPHP
jgi:serine phosphatase RsbU (regulator of sigma subunit)/anti-sigma regulatory factor (Ser/Thr protein kinase)